VKLISHRLVAVADKPALATSVWGRLVDKAQEDDEEVGQDLLHFSQLLSQCLTLDPEHRLDPKTAPKMAFFRRPEDKQEESNKKRVKM
jgi:hypothetical protein